MTSSQPMALFAGFRSAPAGLCRPIVSTRLSAGGKEKELHPMTEEEEEREEKELRRYGAAQAKKLGVKSDKDIERIIQEHRKRQRHAGRS